MAADKTAHKQAAGFHELDGTQLAWTIVGLQVTLLLAALDQTIVATAMPKIVAQLNGFERYAWVTTAYMLSSTTAVPIFGKLSDIFGRKQLLLLGVAGFVLSSALCGMAGGIPWLFGGGMNQLIIFRGLQGIGGGIIMALVFTVIADLFPPAERGKYQGYFTAVWAVASVVGPALGGWITDHWTWRWVFYVNLPVGFVATIVLWRAFPAFAPARKIAAVDYPGVGALIGFMIPLLLGLTLVANQGIASPSVAAMFVVAAIVFCLFLYLEARAAEPIIPLSIFKEPIMAVSATSLFVMTMSMFGATLFMPLFLQSVLGVSATRSGSLMMSMMLAVPAGATVSGQIVTRLGRYKKVTFSGLSLIVVASGLLATINGGTSQLTCCLYLALLGVGLGLLMPTYTVAVQNVAGPGQLGVVTAATQFCRSIGGTVGAAVFGSILLSRYTAHFKELAPAGVSEAVMAPFVNPLALARLQAHLSTALGTSVEAKRLAAVLLSNVRESLVYASDSIFLSSFSLAVLAFLLNFFLRDVPLRRHHHGQGPAAAEAAAPVLVE